MNDWTTTVISGLVSLAVGAIALKNLNLTESSKMFGQAREVLNERDLMAKQYAKVQAELERVTVVNENLKEQIAKQSQVIAQQAATIEELTAQVAALKSQIQELTNSK